MGNNYNILMIKNYLFLVNILTIVFSIPDNPDVGYRVGKVK